jgi:hypothetical protein
VPQVPFGTLSALINIALLGPSLCAGRPLIICSRFCTRMAM